MDQGKLDLVTPMEVGTASVNWGFDPLYTWTKTPPFERMLDEMAAAGYAGTEISYHFPSDPDELRPELERRRLRAAATFHAVNLRDDSKHDAAIEHVAPVVERLRRLGSDVLILSDQPSEPRLAVAGRVAANGRDGLDEKGWRALGDGLNRLGEVLAGGAMQAVFHPHVGTYVETRAEIDRLCELTDPALIGLCPDTGHLAYAGVAPEDIFRDYAGRVGYVHLKDVDAEKLELVRSQNIGFVRAVEMGLFVELGTGIVPISKIMERLTRAGYKGWIIVEQDAAPQPLYAATKNRQFLRAEFGV